MPASSCANSIHQLTLDGGLGTSVNKGVTVALGTHDGHHDPGRMVSSARLVWRGGIMAARSYPTYPDLAGKVAVVSGGSRGIGAANCRLLAQNGAKVTVNGRD